MRNSLFGYFLLFLSVVTLGACSKFSKLQKEGTLEQKYEAALQYYKKADYYHAGLLFEEITPLLNGKDARQAELAQFYNAYCNFKQANYNMAQFLFKNFYETFQRSEYAQEALYMHAYSLYKDSPNSNLDQTNTLTAISALQDFINTYPESAFREESTQLILELRDKLERKAYDKAKLYYKTSEANIANFRSAVVAINNFQKDFPDSKYNEELAFLRVDAQYNLARLSFIDKQKERFQDVNKYYLTFIDKYPQSKYLRQAERFYENTQKELEVVLQAEKVANEAKSNTGKLSTPSSSQN
ncbi:outer membrane protein assembly factor BamD [Runella sp. MFBS21]|uniref:outer membrane protein assembly factor BamD n=1 Tax=Runella sp. MFBS21 TaxID=3034018 RepID=UPI0023F820C4|nr:outer membrane protein assembly factor BamD [Runella sp. MFBS21]MDF7821143.1 outer membrane protein assembly factor BamD [Runella sp. MFBS21]